MTPELLEKLVLLGKQQGASDLHLEPESSPIYRVRGELVNKGDPLSAETLLALAKSLFKSSEAWQNFIDRKSADTSKTISGVRCRINCFISLKGISFSIRLLTAFRNTLRSTNLHPDLKKILAAETGLIIISGPTGSGKSTTLAAFIEEFNLHTRSHIISIESPIEYYFKNRNSIIRQREVSTHTPSFAQGILDSLREDPDVLVIGEMREPEVMRLTLNAAETGHLVLATMHSSSCAETLSRLCMSFSPDIQPSIQSQIADCLIAVINQRLVYLPNEKILVPCLEIMKTSNSVKAHIRSGTMSHLISSIQTGAEEGMYTFERYRKWIDQKHDWVMPSQAPPLEESESPAEKVKLTPSPSVKTSTPIKPTPKEALLGDRLEIDVDDIDLAKLVKDLDKV